MHTKSQRNSPAFLVNFRTNGKHLLKTEKICIFCLFYKKKPSSFFKSADMNESTNTIAPSQCKEYEEFLEDRDFFAVNNPEKALRFAQNEFEHTPKSEKVGCREAIAKLFEIFSLVATKCPYKVCDAIKDLLKSNKDPVRAMLLEESAGILAQLVLHEEKTNRENPNPKLAHEPNPNTSAPIELLRVIAKHSGATGCFFYDLYGKVSVDGKDFILFISTLENEDSPICFATIPLQTSVLGKFQILNRTVFGKQKPGQPCFTSGTFSGFIKDDFFAGFSADTLSLTFNGKDTLSYYKNFISKVIPIAESFSSLNECGQIVPLKDLLLNRYTKGTRHANIKAEESAHKKALKTAFHSQP